MWMLNEWTPCSKMLPDIDGVYYVTIEYPNGLREVDSLHYGHIFLDETTEKVWFERDDIGEWEFSEKVVAWMPFPKPPTVYLGE